jgi:hypothetical protein
MLSGAVNTTPRPRPRPPGRTRRISSRVKSSPPPPYAATSPHHDLQDNSGLKRECSPEDIAWDSVGDHPEDWNGRSSEELSTLLLKADELIKDRENGSFWFFGGSSQNIKLRSLFPSRTQRNDRRL